jgi:hypothetical protein
VKINIGRLLRKLVDLIVKGREAGLWSEKNGPKAGDGGLQGPK